ncbi:MAG: hypothetical protein ACTHLN_14830 [Tepidisphaeraceae bacterium]
MTGETREGTPLAWAGYLGASWTWCIGMFLPVLLVRDYGPWAWVVFALPNCIGAAAMGWVMHSREQSERYTERHAFACQLFSLVTIAFQLFFAMWMFPRLLGNWGYLGAAIVVQSAFLPMLRTSQVLRWSIATLLVSALVALLLAARGSLAAPAAVDVTPGSLIGLTLVCLLGFFTCPYLDLTFHRARQQTTDAGAKLAFGVGFCVLFCSMIVLTFFYAPTIFRMTGLSAWLLVAHFTAQLSFTVSAHARSVTESLERFFQSPGRAELGVTLAVGLLAGLVAQFTRVNELLYHGLPVGEIIYRLFMSFYGLVFPTYVILALAWPRAIGNGRGKVYLAWLGIVVIALPFYWLAFIEARMAWAIAGAAVVVVGAIASRRLIRPAAVAPIGRIR